MSLEQSIFVKNIPYTSTEEDIRALFAPAGTIVSVALGVRHGRPKRPSGNATIEFSTVAEASTAIAKFNGTDLGGRILEVRQEHAPERRVTAPREPVVRAVATPRARPRVLCFGDSNTWGTHPVSPTRVEQRWPVRFARATGALVIEEGCGGRTTVFDDPTYCKPPGLPAHKNGLLYYLPCIHSQRPLDAVIIMLGTNDCKATINQPVEAIAAGMLRVAKATSEPLSPVGAGGKPPAVLLVVPPPMVFSAETTVYTAEHDFYGGDVKSAALEGALRAAYEKEPDDVREHIRIAAIHGVAPGKDGVHFDGDAHSDIARQIITAARDAFPLLFRRRPRRGGRAAAGAPATDIATAN